MISACHLLPSPAHLECQSKLVCRVREASSDCYLSTLGSIANRSLSRFFLIYYLVLLPRIPVAPPGRPVVVPPDISSRSSFAFSVHSVHISSSIQFYRAPSRSFRDRFAPLSSAAVSVRSGIGVFQYHLLHRRRSYRRGLHMPLFRAPQISLHCDRFYLFSF